LVFNVVLNALLIFGFGNIPPLGVEGAALATLISRGVEMLGLLLGSLLGRLPNPGPWRKFFSYPKGFFLDYLCIAGPVFANEIVWSSGITVLQSLYAKLGASATAAVAVLDLAIQVTFVVFMGTGSAAAILVGHAIGENNEKLARSHAQNFAQWAPRAGLVATLLLIPLGFFLPKAFSLSSEGSWMASQLIWVLAAVMPFKSYMHHLIIGVFRGGGDTTFSLVMDLIGLYGVSIPLALLGIFVLKLPLPVVYGMVVLEELVKSVFSWFRLKSGKWYHRVVGEPIPEERLPLL